MRFLTTSCSAGSRPNPGHPHGKAFIPAGSVVVLPDDYLPSRFWTPLDEAAQAALGRAKADYVAHLESRRRQRALPPLIEEDRAELLAVPPVGEEPFGAPVYDLVRDDFPGTRRRQRAADTEFRPAPRAADK